MERVAITVEFERPGSHTLTECAELVMHQMRASPEWDDPAGTGQLNYVCYDRTMKITQCSLLSEPKKK